MAAIVLRIEAVTEPETGIWCSTCALPSIVRMTMAVLSGDHIVHIAPYERCTSCPEESILLG